MAEYTAIYEAGNALCELFRRNMTPEPISKPELIGLCDPYEPEDFQLTVHLMHVEDSSPGGVSPYVQESVNVQRRAPMSLKLTYMITAHSKAPVQTRAADEQRILGRVMQIMRDNSTLFGELLSGSTRENEDKISIHIAKANFEQMTKYWTSSSKPYKFSLICQLSPVVIDSNNVRFVGRVKDIQIALDETPVRREEKEQ